MTIFHAAELHREKEKCSLLWTIQAIKLIFDSDPYNNVLQVQQVQKLPHYVNYSIFTSRPIIPFSLLTIRYLNTTVKWSSIEQTSAVCPKLLKTHCLRMNAWMNRLGDYNQIHSGVSITSTILLWRITRRRLLSPNTKWSVSSLYFLFKFSAFFIHAPCIRWMFCKFAFYYWAVQENLDLQNQGLDIPFSVHWTKL